MPVSTRIKVSPDDWSRPCRNWRIYDRFGCSNFRPAFGHNGRSTRDRTVKLISQRETFFGETSQDETDAISICMFLTMIARVASDADSHSEMRVL
jgi:hypothetical protein